MPIDIVTAKDALAELNRQANPQRAQHSARFFKTGPGEYSEGDRFLGLPVPQTRTIAKRCLLPLSEIMRLLKSEWHEARLLALLLMVKRYGDASAPEQAELYRSYLAHTKYINNWDLVDSSAGYIVGSYLLDRSRAPLYKLARSKSLWERRIAIIATFAFIMEGQPEETLQVATTLLNDKHDLIHKASGWMLREVGKRCSVKMLTQYLDDHATQMPRTMLRYAIERLPPKQRSHYLSLGR